MDRPTESREEPVLVILAMCLVASAVGLKTKSYKAWELALGVTTGLALSTTSLGKGMVGGLASLGSQLPGWLN
jgi:hypothetical protein